MSKKSQKKLFQRKKKQLSKSGKLRTRRSQAYQKNFSSFLEKSFYSELLCQNHYSRLACTRLELLGRKSPSKRQLKHCTPRKFCILRISSQASTMLGRFLLI